MSAKDQLLAQYDLHNLLFNNVIVDISDEEAAKVLVAPMNTVKWLAGHLVWGQAGLARIAGVQLDIPWLSLYDTQSRKPIPEGLTAPTMDEVKAAWNKYADEIRNGLANLPAEALNSPVEFPMPMFNTLEGLWAFINHHQAYTIGQIGILRRGLGKDAMKYV
jgi:hypothetical protein